jgi:hypothetical protein
MAAALRDWLQLAARYCGSQCILALGGPADEAARVLTAKSARVELLKANEEELQRRLRRIFETHGLRMMTSAARNIAGDGVRIAPGWMTSYLRDKEIRLAGIWRTTREESSRAINQILLDAELEPFRPSVGEIARRISTQFIGAAEGRPADVRPDVTRPSRPPAEIPGGLEIFVPSGPEIGRPARALPTTSVATLPRRGVKGELLAFSPERAALIARTEMTIANNEGAAAAYDAAGVRKIKWLAYRDNRSGNRHHETMHGVVRELKGAPFTVPNPKKIFTGPFEQMRWPGDSRADIKHLANCRCSYKAV